MKLLRILVALVLYSQLALAAFDWRFADPNSQLIAGSTVTPTASNPVAYFFLSRWAPLNRLPPSFLSSSPKVQTITYSAVTTRLEVVVLGGTFDFAAIRSAAGSAGMTAHFYRQIEILAGQNSNRDQIALISNNTIVFGSPASLPAAIDRSIDSPTQSLTNSLIQQSFSFAPGWDLFAIASGMESHSLFNAVAVKKYLNSKAPSLGVELAASLGFNFRARTQSTFRLELNITEPDALSASNAAGAMAAIPSQIKATGVGVASLLQAVAANTSITAVGPVIEIVMDPNVYTLTTVVSPPGAGSISPFTAGATFAANSAIALTATPGACYSPATWSANAPSGVVTMTGPQTVTATFASVSAVAIASAAAVTQGGFRFNNGSGRYQQALTLVNSGPPLTNVSLVFDGLTPGVTLFNADGVTACAPSGSPYRNVNTLFSGATALVVEFSVPNPAVAVQYAPRLLSGTGSR